MGNSNTWRLATSFRRPSNTWNLSKRYGLANMRSVIAILNQPSTRSRLARKAKREYTSSSFWMVKMAPRTIYLSRLLGLYCVLVGLAMLTNRYATVETVTAMVHNASLMFLTG